MGEVAARGSDYAVVTSDNPRGEDPLAIIGEIEAGLSGERGDMPSFRIAGKLFAMRSRWRSRATPLSLQAKGHEAYQVIGNNLSV